ncbi:glycosyltransferase family 4 protein [Salinisphaera sp. SPP-AMP-43]|uniref:glycosyltransferase family 4 protein n=1 Tax=Salinisphaera sp. SPP-AMP-43 TaxID=3121288 RepID=UPI003C6E7AEF
MDILMHAPWPYEYATELASALADSGCGDHVCLQTRANYPYAQALTARLSQPYPDPAAAGNRASRGLAHATGVARVVRQLQCERPDVFHIQALHRPALDWPLIVAARAAGAAVVWTAHNALPHENRRYDAVLFRRIYRHVDAVIAHTEQTAARLVNELGAPAARVHRIAHGGFARTAAPAPTRGAARAALELAGDVFVLLFFGRIRPYKGLDVLVAALDRLAGHRVIAIVAGHDQFGEAAKLAGRIDVRLDLRRVDAETTAQYFAAADLVVLPYRAIDQSGVLMLALTYGSAVAATDVGGLGEIIEHGHTGFLLPAPDSQALANLIIELRRDPARLAHVRQNVSRALASQLGWTHLAAETRAVYRTLREPQTTSETLPESGRATGHDRPS